MRRITNPFTYLFSFSPAFRWTALIRVISALGFAVTIPFLSIYLHEELGVSMTWIGAMLAAAGILGSAGATFTGALSDSLGRRGLLVTVLAARAGTFLLLAWMVWDRWTFGHFAAVYILSALLGASIFPLMDAVVSDVVAPERRNEAYGGMRAVANVGWALGPAIGGILVSAGYYVLFIVTAALVGVSTLIARLKLPETARTNAEAKSHLDFSPIHKDVQLRRFLLVLMVLTLVRGQFIAPLSVYAKSTLGLSTAQIGMLYLLNGLMVVGLQVPVAALLRSFQPLRIISIAAMLYAVSYFLIGHAHTYPQMLLLMVGVTGAEIMEAPTVTTYVSMMAPQGRTGVYMGLLGMVIHLGWTVGPLLGGALMDLLTLPESMWTGIALLAMVAALGFARLERGASRVSELR